MDFLFFDKAEKISNPIPRCNLLQIFRFLELCFVLVFLSWSLSRLPIAVRISAEYAGKLFGFIASPLFGFLLCNAIIVALVAKPTKFAVRTESSTDRIYEDLIEKSGTGEVPESDSAVSAEDVEVEIVYQDKQIIVEAIRSVDREIEVKKIADPESECGVGDRKVMVRSLSEKLTRECVEVKTESCEKLRRSETAEKCRNLERSYEFLYYQDDLSSEEFQRKIEAFIAKEKKFRREESSAIVLHCDG